MNKSILSCLSVMVLGAASPALADHETLWQLNGFDQPESVVADPSGRHLYVSNINGQPGEKNSKGYISRLDPKGRVIDRHWVTGLNAPKGMAVHGGRLYVTDIERFLVIDLQGGEIVEEFSPPDARFLNDVTVDESGVVYVSDMMANALYRYADGAFEVWLQDERLMHPNGVLLDGDALVVAGWGTPIAEDFTTQVPGSLVRISLEDRSLKPVAGGGDLGNLDGVVRMGEYFLVNDWMNGQLYKVAGNGGGHTLVETFAPGVADMGVLGEVVYLPYMFDGEVRAVRLQ